MKKYNKVAWQNIINQLSARISVTSIMTLGEANAIIADEER